LTRDCSIYDTKTHNTSLKYSAWQLSFQNVQNLSVKSKFHVEIHYRHSTLTRYISDPRNITQHRGDCRTVIWMYVSFVEFLVTIWLLDLLFLMILKVSSLHHLLCTPWHRYPQRTHQYSELYMCIQCNGMFTFEEKIPCAVVHCRVPSRFSYFLNITSLIGKSKTQLPCAVLQTVFSCKYYVFMFCKYCSLMSIILE
jgi:hypothetical protein